MIIRKLNKFILLFSITLASAALGHGDGEESRIAIEPSINTSTQAGLITYQFEPVDTKLRTVVGPDDLNILHEKPIHIFIFDTSLQNTNMGNDSHLMIHVTFPAKGEYRLWIQFQDRGELKTVPLSLKID